MKKVVVVGGGASGLVAALCAKNSNNEVVILERNKECAKKILVTGNGRCNFWNEDQKLVHYHSTNKDAIKEIITEENKRLVDDFFGKIGIVAKVKNGYYYPFSNQAVSVKNALLTEVSKRGIEIMNDTYVETIKRLENGFELITSVGKLFADIVVIATGSKAAPKTGSDGNGYSLVKPFSHTLIEVLPALVQLKGFGNYFKEWDGIRTDVKIFLLEDDKIVRSESGEIQLTDYGVSGICVFNLSGGISRGLYDGKKEALIINFLPFVEGSAKQWLDNQSSLVYKRTVEELLSGILNIKLVKLILKLSGIKNNVFYDQLSDNDKALLVKNLTNFKLDITGTNSFDKAQVCTGGIALDEINLETMESLKCKNLYITGEILDIDGDCGGYNLGFAWISGILAGRSIKEMQDD